MLLGAHLGIADGLAEAVAAAERLDADCLQIFSKSPQTWGGPPISAEAAEGFRRALRGSRVRATAIHHGYLLNLASPKPEMLERSRSAFLDEIARADLLGVDALIFHPGAHLGTGVDTGLATLCESLQAALESTSGSPTRLLLENAAGQGSTLCSTLGELAEVLRRVPDARRLGVTLDTCHLFAAGVDLRTEEGYGGLVDQIRATIGEANVRAFHLNDAMAGVGSHLDRHQNIGHGEIGAEGFRRLVNDPRWREVPGYLETPLDERDYARYAEDLATLRGLGAVRARPSSRPGPPRGSRPAPRPGSAASARSGRKRPANSGAGPKSRTRRGGRSAG